jgi:hypothetical protein
MIHNNNNTDTNNIEDKQTPILMGWIHPLILEGPKTSQGNANGDRQSISKCARLPEKALPKPWQNNNVAVQGN